MNLMKLVISFIFCLATGEAFKFSPVKHTRSIIFGSTIPNKNIIASEEARTFSSYVIYKGKAALAVKPIPPTFAPGKSGQNSRVLSRQGIG